MSVRLNDDLVVNGDRADHCQAHDRRQLGIRRRLARELARGTAARLQGCRLLVYAVESGEGQHRKRHHYQREANPHLSIVVSSSDGVKRRTDRPRAFRQRPDARAAAPPGRRMQVSAPPAILSSQTDAADVTKGIMNPAGTLRLSAVMRLLVGVAIQPFLAGGLAFASFRVLLLDRNGRTLAGGFPSDVTDAALSVALGAALVAVFVTLLGALPTAVWLMMRQPVPLGRALLFGLGFGNLPFVAGTVFGGAYGLGGFVRGLAFASLLGLAGAAAFWVVALREHATFRHDPFPWYR